MLEAVERIGAFAGLAAFLGLAVFALISFTQGRDIRRLREWAGSAPERDIAVEFTQPRPGEKLHEELFSSGEEPQPTAARRINRAVRRTPLDQEWVESTLNSLEHLVLAGDEANLAERVVEMIAAPGGDAATVVPNE